ncbi:Guanine nucleotide-binding protein alpha-1 subunit [Vitis vinifera]|uniref:Guanine nucleotide-binding protein alpha-1 subunit n=1 Tax=Vitis vinifera TaxID=29760 RepID=A0A438EX56_VITVI|nr:Guanine nucleotide-binding protein alpha-1 subunit [Vitis vinifera]
MLSIVIERMGSICSRHKHYHEADAEENAQAAEIERRIEQETKAEKHIQKLLLLERGLGLGSPPVYYTVPSTCLQNPVAY